MSAWTIRIALVIAVTFVALAAAPMAEACCRPCFGFCDETNLEAFCCSGIPEPGNICGLTTCKEFLSGEPTAEQATLAVENAEAPAMSIDDGVTCEDALMRELAAVPTAD